MCSSRQCPSTAGRERRWRHPVWVALGPVWDPLRPRRSLTNGRRPKRLAKSPGIAERPGGVREGGACCCGSRCVHGRSQCVVADNRAVVKEWETAEASENFGERVEEAPVLVGQAVGDAYRGRVAAERAACAHEHAALSQPAHDLCLVTILTQVHPAE